MTRLETEGSELVHACPPTLSIILVAVSVGQVHPSTLRRNESPDGKWCDIYGARIRVYRVSSEPVDRGVTIATRSSGRSTGCAEAARLARGTP